MKNKYYGPKKIKESHGNGDSMVLTFDDDTTETISMKMVEHVITDKSVDLTSLRDLRLRPVVEEMLEIMLNWDIKIHEIQYLTTLMVTSINDSIDKASNKLWKVNDVDDRSVGLVNKVLKEDGSK